MHIARDGTPQTFQQRRWRASSPSCKEHNAAAFSILLREHRIVFGQGPIACRLSLPFGEFWVSKGAVSFSFFLPIPKNEYMWTLGICFRFRQIRPRSAWRLWPPLCSRPPHRIFGWELSKGTKVGTFKGFCRPQIFLMELRAQSTISIEWCLFYIEFDCYYKNLKGERRKLTSFFGMCNADKWICKQACSWSEFLGVFMLTFF